jgi:1,3-beta-glucanosyltransferase GAS3
MQMLGINTIRVYNLDPSLDHDLCASIFNAVGIYLLLDVNSPLPHESLNPEDLAGSYDSEYLKRTFAVVEAFHNFPNTLGFFGGNEVLDKIENGDTVPPYLRAVTRDLKNYIAKHSPRAIPVGYSAAAIKELLVDSLSYLQCVIGGSKDDPSKIDFFGLNTYAWCEEDDTLDTSGYRVLISKFSDSKIPVFFSEYGCNRVSPRVFNEVGALYGPDMAPVMSGGLVYEYAQEPNNYGLVALNQNGTAQLLADYDHLQAQYNKLDIEALQSDDDSVADEVAPKCEGNLIESSSFAHTFGLPKVPPGGQDLIDQGIGNPNNGKLVPVNTTKVSQAVFGSRGKQLQDLAIKPLPDDQSNIPNGIDTSGPDAPSATSTKKNTATHQEFGMVISASLLAVILIVFPSAFAF